MRARREEEGKEGRKENDIPLSLMPKISPQN
jgi:hypothetical protein